VVKKCREGWQISATIARTLYTEQQCSLVPDQSSEVLATAPSAQPQLLLEAKFTLFHKLEKENWKESSLNYTMTLFQRQLRTLEL
jgi:hypothetical protein